MRTILALAILATSLMLGGLLPPQSGRLRRALAATCERAGQVG